MFQARKSIMSLGLLEARKATKSKAERVCVDAAWSTLHETDESIIFTSRVVTSLPHKRGAEVDSWEQDAGDGVYRWDASNSEGGLPFGSKSRMILIHLLHEAMSNMNPCVDCGNTLYKWNARIQNTSVGGMTYRIILDHAWRILQSRLSVNPGDKLCNNIARATAVGNNRVPTEIELELSFFQHVIDHKIPVRHSALQLIKNNSAAIDLYIRMSDGLPKLSSPLLATWPELKRRFGAGYKNIRQMKPAFLDTLSLVSAVYPEANISALPEGILLRPSLSSVEGIQNQSASVMAKVPLSKPLYKQNSGTSPLKENRLQAVALG